MFPTRVQNTRPECSVKKHTRHSVRCTAAIKAKKHSNKQRNDEEEVGNKKRNTLIYIIYIQAKRSICNGERCRMFVLLQSSKTNQNPHRTFRFFGIDGALVVCVFMKIHTFTSHPCWFSLQSLWPTACYCYKLILLLLSSSSLYLVSSPLLRSSFDHIPTNIRLNARLLKKGA